MRKLQRLSPGGVCRRLVTVGLLSLTAASVQAQRLPPDPASPPDNSALPAAIETAPDEPRAADPSEVAGPSPPSTAPKSNAVDTAATPVSSDAAVSAVDPAGPDASLAGDTGAGSTDGASTDLQGGDASLPTSESEPAPSAPVRPTGEKVPVESAILGRADPNAAARPADGLEAPVERSPPDPEVHVDEHDAPEVLDTPPSAPSAFWLDGTARESADDTDAAAPDDASANDPDALIAAPADPSAYGPPPPNPDANEFGVSPMTLLGHTVAPASRERLTWTTGQSFSGSVMETPVIVVHGIKPGPRLCLTAGVHGDELNGVEVVRRLAYKIEPQDLAGTVIAVPIVNLLGFSRGTRYLPDRRDLNRFFPGSPNGSSASRIAHNFFSAIIDHCDALVDFHTGSLDRANLPQVRGDLTIPSVVEFTRGFGATAVLHSPGALGMLRFAASNYGVPSVTFEIGGPMRLQPDEIEHGEQAIETLMHKMGMVERRRRWDEPQAVFYESTWVRVDQGGMLFSEVELGDRVSAGQRLGRVIDPVSNRSSEIVVPEDGRVIGMALNQLVLPGFAAYHLGVAASEERVVNEAEQPAAPGDERFLEYDQLDEDAGPEAVQPVDEVEPPIAADPVPDPLEED